MAFGAPGQEQFRRAITQMRNHHICAVIAPLMVLRQEVIGDDSLSDRGGLDTPAQKHFIDLLVRCDKWRRLVTHNPDNKPLGDKIAKAIDNEAAIDIGENPFGGDDIQNASSGLFDLPFSLDGTDDDIPLNSKLKLLSGPGRILVGAIDATIVAWTRLNSRDLSRFITQADSMRMYGHYQQILAYLKTFGGDENRVDVAQVLPSEEPLGPTDSPNMLAETTGNSKRPN